MLGEILLGERCHFRRCPSFALNQHRVTPVERLSEDDPRLITSLVEGKQWSVLPDRLAAGVARLAIPILNNVAPDTARFHADAETRQFRVPDHDLLTDRGQRFDD